MKSKLKIAFLLSIITERGGIGRVTSIISNELNNHPDFDIHIISYARKKENSYDWNNKLPYHYLLEEQIPMKKGIITASKKLKNILSTNNIDILISSGAIVGPLGVLGTVFNKTKLIYWSHSSFKGTSKKQFRMFNEHFTALFAKCIVSLTKTDEVNYAKETRAKKVVQIYNPIDSKLENNDKEYSSTSKKIVSVGRLTAQKNFETLIDVAAIVLSEHKDFTWDIYGSGEEEDLLQKKIKTNNLIGKVNLMGQSSNLYELYNEYALMVMTSKYEGFPMSLIEGLASNLPLVSFDIPTGPNEIIHEGTNGFLIEPFDVADMAKKISILINDEDLRISFSKKNPKLINEFNLSTITKKWITLLNKL
ncbi:glycosyltransferase family 4 protein [Maribacter forsetii]|uniref:glycosyltransferase family 4 protein n=1 Tax=Maribacter forsetii TaxID=444515 RepID=UPI00056A910A|nr:glycosyltransferase family 4 protein [Maribacter forsetii]